MELYMSGYIELS